MIKDAITANEAVTPNDREIAILKEHFPACFKEDGSFDLERFREFLSDKVHIISEGYELKFLGKNYARLLASLDTTTVIQPDEEHNTKPENAASENIYISGDNLDALKHLLKSYARQVKCIYIDPPYNTGSDGFVYNDNFNFTAEELSEKLSISEEQAQRILDLTKRGSASHSAWLMFMYPRLQLARDLLRDNGAIFISIDDNEQANLKLICDDIFGEENFAGQFPWRKRTAKSDVPFGISQDYEVVLCYAKISLFSVSIEGGTRKYIETPDFPGRLWRFHDLTTQRTIQERPNSNFTMVNPRTGEKYPVNPNRCWAVTQDTFNQYYEEHRIIFPGDYPFLNISKPVFRYWKSDDIEKAGDDFGKMAVSTRLPDTVGMSQDGTKEITDLFGSKVFSFPKPTELLKYLIKISTADDDMILDFFSGSATSAHAVMKLNDEDGFSRKFIMVQLQEPVREGSDAEKAGYSTVNQIGIERIIRAAKVIKEANPETTADLGFKHFTLVEPSGKTLDKMEVFEPDNMFADEDILKQFGKPTVLATWLNYDGYGLNAVVETLDLNGYTAYHCRKHLYLIDPNFNEDALKALMAKYESDGAFNPDNVILFGYSFVWRESEMLSVNLKRLKETEKNLRVNLDIRY